MEKPNLKITKQASLANIGQLLIICFLFFVILMQTVNIITDAKKSAGGSVHSQEGASRNANISEHPPNSANETYINADAAQNLNANINNTDNTYNPADKSRAGSINSESSETLFILGESGGRLAVFSPDRLTIYEIFNVYIDTLPDYDKNLLQNGIKIKTPEQLYSLLEDYSS